MGYMFRGAEAFNQPLAFDTARVKFVRVYLLEVRQSNHYETTDSDFLILSNIFSDEQHVLCRRSLQSTTSFQHYWGYKCESIFVWNPTAMNDLMLIFLFSAQFIRWATCSGVQQPSINHYLSILLRLQMWVHMLASSLTTAMRNLILISFFLPYRCSPCSKVQQPSIRTCVILEAISARSVWWTYFWTLDAVSKKPRPVQLGRGVPSTPILSSEPQFRSILAKDVQQTWTAKPVPTIEAQWVVYGDLP